MNNTYSYLALGDSYTIGEGVQRSDTYPYQAVRLLKLKNSFFQEPEIIARTGWTTSDLLDEINKTVFTHTYDFVTLLIGVNNQYRNQPADQYAREFEELLKIALSKVDQVSYRATVLSIPNWGLSPFGKDRDRSSVTREISHFNTVNRAMSHIYGVNYIDITTGSPETDSDPGFFAADGLHPSPKAYLRWAAMLAETLALQAIRYGR